MPNVTDEVVWKGQPPAACGMCHAPFLTEFFDAQTVYAMWAYMCRECHTKEGIGIGRGIGRRFSLQPDGVWLKTLG